MSGANLRQAHVNKLSRVPRAPFFVVVEMFHARLARLDRVDSGVVARLRASPVECKCNCVRGVLPLAADKTSTSLL
jgi:hypothetical protein